MEVDIWFGVFSVRVDVRSEWSDVSLVVRNSARRQKKKKKVKTKTIASAEAQGKNG